LKAGAVYVPLDKANPPARLALMLAQLTSLKLVLASEDTNAALQGANVTVLNIDTLWLQLSRMKLDNIRREIKPQDLCYIVFTSGTTGTPKAVAITHDNWANLITWLIEEYTLTPLSNNLLVSAFGFDISQRSLLTPLCSGATLTILQSAVFDPLEAVKCIAKNKIQTLHLAPSALYLILGADNGKQQLSSLRNLFIGGEALSIRRVIDWAKKDGRDCELIHQYGVAECTDVATSYRMKNFDSYVHDGIPMGDPVANCHVDIIHENGEPVGPSETGQIAISGKGVGPGYLNNPALQAERFKQLTINGQRRLVYLTGDFARRLPNGSVVCIGRKDSQFKVRGMMINTLDVENGLRAVLPNSDDVVILAVAGQPLGDTVLVAFIATNRKEFDRTTVGHALSRMLPRYMHPQRYVVLPEFPLTQNGKIDRHALLTSVSGIMETVVS